LAKLTQKLTKKKKAKEDLARAAELTEELVALRDVFGKEQVQFLASKILRAWLYNITWQAKAQADADNEMLVSMLINQEADLESRAYDGSTALLRACETGNIRMVRTLLKAGVRFSSSAI
jgi:hypothetical protein